MSEIPRIDKEFIEENNKLGKTMQILPKKGGPYTRAERQKRRDEVFKMHFLYGWPASRIARVMQVNRNTINNDLYTAYPALYKEWRLKEQFIGAYLEKQMIRMDWQRAKLLEMLGDDTRIEHRLAIEKLILDIDSRLASTMIKGASTSDSIQHEVVQRLNEASENHGLDHRWISKWQMLKATPRQYARIQAILDEAA